MFKPLNGRVLILPEEAEQVSEYGILLPDKKEKPVNGTVVVGGELVQEGQRVVFSKFGYDEVTINKQTYFVVSEHNIMGIYC